MLSGEEQDIEECDGHDLVVRYDNSDQTVDVEIYINEIINLTFSSNISEECKNVLSIDYKGNKI